MNLLKYKIINSSNGSDNNLNINELKIHELAIDELKKAEFNIEIKLPNNLLILLDILKKYSNKIFIVGGAVRDSIAKLEFNDYDIATDITPNNLVEILQKEKIKYLETGKIFGTITAVIEKTNFEITTFRKDVLCDGRYAKVEYSDKIADDAKRRDFSINALYFDPFKNIIYDFFDGVKDLYCKNIVFIGNPEERIEEDYLRIIRFFRFTSKYSNKIDEDALKACKNNIEKLSNLSKERIFNELYKIFSLKKDISFVIKKMIDIGAFKIIFKNSKISYEYLDIFEKILLKENLNENIFEIRMSLLLFSNSLDNIETLIKENKFPNKSIKFILDICDFIQKIINNNKSYNFLLKKTIYKKNNIFHKLSIITRIFLGEICIKDIEKIKNNFLENNIFPVTSSELMKLGINGKKLGLILHKLENIWIESDFKVKKEELLKNIDI